MLTKGGEAGKTKQGQAEILHVLLLCEKAVEDAAGEITWCFSPTEKVTTFLTVERVKMFELYSRIMAKCIAFYTIAVASWLRSRSSA